MSLYELRSCWCRGPYFLGVSHPPASFTLSAFSFAGFLEFWGEGLVKTSGLGLSVPRSPTIYLISGYRATYLFLSAIEGSSVILVFLTRSLFSTVTHACKANTLLTELSPAPNLLWAEMFSQLTYVTLGNHSWAKNSILYRGIGDTRRVIQSHTNQAWYNHARSDHWHLMLLY